MRTGYKIDGSGTPLVTVENIVKQSASNKKQTNTHYTVGI